MSYAPNNLSALAYANGFTLWHYRTDDPVQDVMEPNYFDGARNMLRVGDHIVLNAGAGRQNAVVAVMSAPREPYASAPPVTVKLLSYCGDAWQSCPACGGTGRVQDAA